MRLAHRCTRCGHLDNQHEAVRCSHGLCWHCSNDKAEWSASELIPTFDTKGRVIQAVTQPGEVWNAECNARFQTCSCPECIDLYRAETQGQVTA